MSMNVWCRGLRRALVVMPLLLCARAALAQQPTTRELERINWM
jgi:hypothetical protein